MCKSPDAPWQTPLATGATQAPTGETTHMGKAPTVTNSRNWYLRFYQFHSQALRKVSKSALPHYWLTLSKSKTSGKVCIDCTTLWQANDSSMCSKGVRLSRSVAQPCAPRAHRMLTDITLSGSEIIEADGGSFLRWLFVLSRCYGVSAIGSGWKVLHY